MLDNDNPVVAPPEVNPEQPSAKSGISPGIGYQKV